MQDEVLEFINRRFKKDCKWVDGNCYYFAIILKDRFPKGSICYDVIYGHFVFLYKNRLYDWTGLYNNAGNLVEWDKFKEYDSLVYERVVRDCIM